MIGRASFCSTPSHALLGSTIILSLRHSSSTSTSTSKSVDSQQHQQLECVACSSPCSHVSSNLSCDYVTCVSLFFNLRHSRDFTSPTSRRGTLHFSINMLCLSAPHIHHSIFATHSAPRIQRVFCHPQHILMSSPTDVQRPCEGSRMLSRKRKQQQDVLKQYALFTPEQAEVWTCLLYYQTNPTVFANDNSGWT